MPFILIVKQLAYVLIVEEHCVRSAAIRSCIHKRRTRYRWWKKAKGQKRHIVVDVRGNLLAVVVHAANLHDTKSGIEPIVQISHLHTLLKRL